MEFLANPEVWVALVTLVVLEVVLGIDNIIFISILASKLPPNQQDRARQVGLGLAMVSRILLLISLAFLAHVTQPLFTIWGAAISIRDMILAIGGLFLLFKATREIHDRLEGEEGEASAKVGAAFTSVIVQIVLLDIVFSIDSVVTAVGMANDLWVMITAVVIAVIIMLFASAPIAHFVEQHPTIKMLALSFLLLIGLSLLLDGLHQHIPKGYVYFAMGFSVMVEVFNLRIRSGRKPKPVQLREPYKLTTPAIAAAAAAPGLASGPARTQAVSRPAGGARPGKKGKKKGSKR